MFYGLWLLFTKGVHRTCGGVQERDVWPARRCAKMAVSALLLIGLLLGSTALEVNVVIPGRVQPKRQKNSIRSVPRTSQAESLLVKSYGQKQLLKPGLITS